jgi:hypothetical protein
VRCLEVLREEGDEEGVGTGATTALEELFGEEGKGYAAIWLVGMETKSLKEESSAEESNRVLSETRLRPGLKSERPNCG